MVPFLNFNLIRVHEIEITGAHMTLLNKSTDAIEKIKFGQISWKMSDSKQCSLSDDDIALAINEYKRFLTLKIENPTRNLAPTDLMDEVWHFHILDTKRYAEDCQRLFDRFLHHRPSYGPFESLENQRDLSESFDCMMNLYRQKYGHDPISMAASCHTDSDGSACTGLSCCDG